MNLSLQIYQLVKFCYIYFTTGMVLRSLMLLTFE